MQWINDIKNSWKKVNEKVKQFLWAIYTLASGGSAWNNGGMQIKLKTEKMTELKRVIWDGDKYGLVFFTR
jgi:hypothetical protein